MSFLICHRFSYIYDCYSCIGEFIALILIYEFVFYIHAMKIKQIEVFTVYFKVNAICFRKNNVIVKYIIY